MAIFNKLKRNKVLTPQERRAQSIEKLKKMKVAYNAHLPLLESSDHIRIKTLEDIKRRTLACFLSVQLACSIRNGEDYVESVSFLLDLAKKWGLTFDDFLSKEKLLFTNQFTIQDVVDVGWTYEIYWVLLWVLDLITDKEVMKVTDICNTERAMAIAGLINDLDLKLRNVDKILDMADLLYCYHWACVEKRLNPEIEIGKIKSEVVEERRRGFEWLMRDEVDWNAISLDT